LRKVQCILKYFETLLEGTLSNLSTGTTAGELDIIVSRWAEQKKDKESIGNHISVLKETELKGN